MDAGEGSSRNPRALIYRIELLKEEGSDPRYIEVSGDYINQYGIVLDMLEYIEVSASQNTGSRSFEGVRSIPEGKDTISINLNYAQMDALLQFQQSMKKERRRNEGQDVENMRDVKEIWQYDLDTLGSVLESSDALDAEVVARRVSVAIFEMIKNYNVEELRQVFGIEISEEERNSEEFQRFLKYTRETNSVLEKAEIITPLDS
jgi:hypothetical protein